MLTRLVSDRSLQLHFSPSISFFFFADTGRKWPHFRAIRRSKCFSFSPNWRAFLTDKVWRIQMPVRLMCKRTPSWQTFLGGRYCVVLCSFIVLPEASAVKAFLCQSQLFRLLTALPQRGRLDDLPDAQPQNFIGSSPKKSVNTAPFWSFAAETPVQQQQSKKLGTPETQIVTMQTTKITVKNR